MTAAAVDVAVVDALEHLQQASATAEAKTAAWLASLTDEQRATALAERRAFLNLPDPPAWQINGYCERHGTQELK